jgi:hypothetical protein
MTSIPTRLQMVSLPDSIEGPYQWDNWITQKFPKRDGPRARAGGASGLGEPRGKVCAVIDHHAFKEGRKVSIVCKATPHIIPLDPL